MLSRSAGGLRAHAKAAAEAIALGISSLPGIAASMRGRTLVLAYHNIVPVGEDACGDRSLHLGQREFARQLDILAERCSIISLREALHPAPDARPRVAITFDDGYRGALTAGLEELARRRLPATYFIAPYFLEGRSFWWDDLAAPYAAGLPAEMRVHVLTALAGRDALARDWACASGLPLGEMPEHARGAQRAELLAAARVAGITFGSHTWSHPNLSRLSDAEVEEELTSSMRWIGENLDGAISWHTFPYGLSNPIVEEVARRAGYQAALRVRGGWFDDPGNAFRLPRLNVPSGLAANGLRLRLRGRFCS